MLDVRNTYRKPSKGTLVEGAIRMKTWRIPFVTGREASDPLWQGRVRKYWARQAELYGFEHAEATIQVDMFPDRGENYLTTSTKITKVLPGERVEMGRA